MKIFKNQYSNLKKILIMFEFHFQLINLSESYVTLRNHIKRRLFLLSMRKKTIFLKFEKMISAAENRKKSNFSIEKIFIENFIFFDLKNVFQIFLFSEKYRKKMHIEMTEFHNFFFELWYSHN